jgi:hypothetical protein
MAEIRLTRTGDAPLVFSGKEVAQAAGPRRSGRQEQTRWTDLTVYRTEGGKLVAEIVYRSTWQGESDEHRAIVCDDERGLIDALRDYHPVPEGIGFPPGAQFVAKQARLEAALRRDYDERVTAVLETIGAEVRIE